VISTEIFNVIVRSIFIFLVLFGLIKLLGRKQISQLTFFEYVIGITVGNIAASVSIGLKDHFWVGMVGLITWTVIPFILRMITLNNQTIRNILIGKPTIMIKRGKIISNNLSQQKYNKADILELLREKNVFKLSDVEMAVLETNGELTVQKQQQHEEHASPDTQPTISYVKGPEKQYPMEQRKDLFQAIIKKCQADLELYALTTDSTTIKASVKKHIESLNELMENLQSFISKKKT